LIIKRSSWHYKLLKKLSSNNIENTRSSCQYFAKILTEPITAILAVALMAAIVFGLAGVPLMALLHYVGIYTFTGEAALAIVNVGLQVLVFYLGFAIIMFHIWAFKMWNKFEYRFLATDEEIVKRKGESLFKYWYKNVKDRTCSTLTFED
jgi:uncharacterized membrane protein YqjE